MWHFLGQCGICDGLSEEECGFSKEHIPGGNSTHCCNGLGSHLCSVQGELKLSCPVHYRILFFVTQNFVLALSSEHLCIFNFHGPAFIFKKSVILYILPFTELISVGLAIDLVDKPLSFSAMTMLVGHLTRKIVPKMTFNMSCGTLNCTIPILQNVD